MHWSDILCGISDKISHKIPILSKIQFLFDDEILRALNFNSSKVLLKYYTPIHPKPPTQTPPNPQTPTPCDVSACLYILSLYWNITISLFLIIHYQ